MSTNSPLVERSTTRKVVGSLAVLGTAAAVAGLGTYGNFTDSTTPLEHDGRHRHPLDQPGPAGGAVAIPVTTAGFVPGDSMSRAVNLINDGGSALGAVSLSSTVTSPRTSSPRTSSTASSWPSRPAPWPGPRAAPPTAPTYTCAGTERTVLTGPAATPRPWQPRQPRGRRRRQPRVHDLAARRRRTTRSRARPPSLSLTFTGVQRTGTAR